MAKEINSVPIIFWVTFSHPEWQNNLDCSGHSGPLSIGSGYENDLVIDEEGVLENHCVIEAFSSGISVRPVEGPVINASGAVIQEAAVIPFGQAFCIGSVSVEILRQHEGRLRQYFGSSRPDKVLGKTLFRGLLLLANLLVAMRTMTCKMNFARKITVCVLTIMSVGSAIALESTAPPPLPSQYAEPEQLAVIAPSAAEPIRKTNTGETDLSTNSGFRTKRDAATSFELNSGTASQTGTLVQSDETMEQSTSVALEALGGKVEVSSIKNGVATLRGQLKSREEIRRIEEILILDVPALAGVDSSAVQLADRPIKLERNMLPDGIAAVWAGADPYIKMEDGTKYWVGSTLQDGTHIMSIQLDKIHVSRDGKLQAFDIKIGD